MGRVFLPEKKVHAQGTQDAAELGDSVSWCVGGLVAWWLGGLVMNAYCSGVPTLAFSTSDLVVIIVIPAKAGTQSLSPT